MIGQRVKYNKDMSGVIIDENETHILIQFDNAGEYCVSKCGIEINGHCVNEIALRDLFNNKNKIS